MAKKAEPKNLSCHPRIGLACLLSPPQPQLWTVSTNSRMNPPIQVVDSVFNFPWLGHFFLDKICPIFNKNLLSSSCQKSSETSAVTHYTIWPPLWDELNTRQNIQFKTNNFHWWKKLIDEKGTSSVLGELSSKAQRRVVQIHSNACQGRS